MMALQTRSWLWVLLGAGAIALDLFAVAAARSAGALLGLGLAVMAIVALTPLVFAGRVLRAWVTSVVALAMLAVGLSYQWLASAMIQAGAAIFDKDPTLTGRTYLWYRAGDLIREAPLLGRGYQAFWLQGNTDAEGLWRYFGIQERGGFTFHNTAVEILVTLGWVGVMVIGATALVGVVALVRRFVARPNLALVFWIAILLYQLARTPIEAIGLAPLYFSTVLCFASLGAAFGRVRPSRAQAAPRPLRELQVVTVDGRPAAPSAAERGGLQRLRAGPERTS
jgi:exopolysaccharide production protein ExoQ